MASAGEGCARASSTDSSVIGRAPSSVSLLSTAAIASLGSAGTSPAAVWVSWVPAVSVAASSPAASAASDETLPPTATSAAISVPPPSWAASAVAPSAAAPSAANAGSAVATGSAAVSGATVPPLVASWARTAKGVTDSEAASAALAVVVFNRACMGGPFGVRKGYKRTMGEAAARFRPPPPHDFVSSGVTPLQSAFCLSSSVSDIQRFMRASIGSGKTPAKVVMSLFMSPGVMPALPAFIAS